jgi:NAD(P)-dependent dehydrogenase (short-subunit alcohol dehydrogenase family)
MPFTERVAVVTGSSRGIGHALSKRLADAGARVVLADVEGGGDVRLADGTPARFVRTDVGREADVKALVDDVLGREGRIDLFASNAGIHLEMDAGAPEADWQRIVAVNQMSHVWVARHVLPAMLARGEGHLLITASAASFLSEITSVGYAATKYAALGFGEWLAFTYRGRGVTVSVACPGPVWTALIQDAPYLHKGAITPEEAAERVVEGLEAGRFLITTHPTTLSQIRQKAADVDAYVNSLVGFREHALALKANTRG